MSEKVFCNDKVLSPILGDAICDLKNDVVLFQILEVKADVLEVEVEAVLRGQQKVGSKFKVSYMLSPLGDKRPGLNAWNELSLAPRAWIALAGISDKKGFFHALAGQKAEAPPQSLALLRRAVEYVGKASSVTFGTALGQAYAEKDSLAQTVLLCMIDHKLPQPREKVADGLIEVFLSLTLTQHERSVLARYLLSIPIFDPDLGADATNQKLINALSQRILTASDSESLDLTNNLRSGLLREMKEKTRKDFMKAIPNRQKLIERLKTLSPKAEPQNREFNQMLLKALSSK